MSSGILAPDNSGMVKSLGLLTNDTKDMDSFIGILTAAQFKMLIPSFILVVVTMIIGIGGNTITLLVYFKKMRRTASRIFIIALALCDLINCILTMPVEIAIICSFWTFDHPVICSTGRTVTYILNGASALLLVGIAVDRFRKICRPLKPVFTPRKTRFVCLLCVAVGFAVYIPGFVIYGTQTVSISLEGNVSVTGKTCLISDTYVNTKFPLFCMAFWFCLTLAVMVAIITLYISVGRAVYTRMKLEERRHQSVSSAVKPKQNTLVDMYEDTSCSFDDILDNKKESDNEKAAVSHSVLKKIESPSRNRLSQALKNHFSWVKSGTVFSLQRKRESTRIRAGRTTVMLFTVTVAYIASFIPFLVIVALRSLRPGLYVSLSMASKSVWNFFLRSYVLNCSVNPIVYGFCNKEYRKRMMQLFREGFDCNK